MLFSIGSYIAKAIELNPTTFRMFSPDELSSNKLDEALKVSHRNFQWDPEVCMGLVAGYFALVAGY